MKGCYINNPSFPFLSNKLKLFYMPCDYKALIELISNNGLFITF